MVCLLRHGITQVEVNPRENGRATVHMVLQYSRLGIGHTWFYSKFVLPSLALQHTDKKK